MAEPFQSSIRTGNFPVQPTPLIGRANEITDITHLLADLNCRLLTLCGVGGVGKTRLALEVAGQIAPQFAGGVYFVPLRPLHSTDYLVPAIAEALDFTLTGQETPVIQLLRYLRHRKILLVLDNFEQLLNQHGEELLIEILVMTPDVKLLVTSQEVLNLQEEWLYPVEGLPFPRVETEFLLDWAESPAEVLASLPATPAEWQAILETYSAIKLFNERARQINPDFSLADEWHAVLSICQLVEGVPLAIELAAAWVKTLSCAAIAAEIRRAVDFLGTNLRHVPGRQRGIRAVFESCWQWLTQPERNVFRRLSVFRGGFAGEAAAQIAQASPAILTALVDKFLVRPEAGGRYALHELLRYYAVEHLIQSPADVAQIYDLHCSYYANFLQARTHDLLEGQPRQAVDDIATDLANVRMAWQWAIELIKVAEIQKSADPFNLFFCFQGRYLESQRMFERAAQRLRREDSTEPAGPALATVLIKLAWDEIRLGRLAEAELILQQCQAIYRRLNLPAGPELATDPALGLGVIALLRGDYPEAARLAEQARQTAESHDHGRNHQLAAYILARAASGQGYFEAAQQDAQEIRAMTAIKKFLPAQLSALEVPPASTSAETKNTPAGPNIPPVGSELSRSSESRAE